MKKVESAGGVVFYKNTVLLLKKRNGHWVLPKGHIELGESKKEAALREVEEEAGVCAQILEYIDYIEYEFVDFRNNNQEIHKKVFWYLMKSNSEQSKPQLEEGFVEASYIPMLEASKLARHDDERNIINKAVEVFSKKHGA